MKRLITWLVLLVLLLVPVSCTSTSPVSEEKEEGSNESWQIGENWEYSQQAVWGDVMVGSEVEVRDQQRVKPYISTYNLRSREKQRVLELPEDRLVHAAPAIHADRIVWPSVDRDEAEHQRSLRRAPLPNWDVFLLDLKTGEVQQLTTEEHAQVYPKIYGRIVWLRHADYREADIFGYDVETGKETRVSHSGYASFRPTINGDKIVWTDARVSKGNTTNDVVEIVVDQNTGIKERREPGADIYLYDLKTQQEIQLTSTSPTEGGEGWKIWCYPVIHGDFVVYILDRQVNPITYAMKLTYQ